MKKMLALVCALNTASVSAQAPAQGPTFRAGVDVIAVDVSVLDAQGQPVSDLLAPEFNVRIDGQPRRVVSLQLVRPDTARARRLADDANSLYSSNIDQPPGRMIAIAVDQLNSSGTALRPVLNAAARFVDTLGPADRVAFFSYPAPGATVDFTTDHVRIRRAMDATGGSQLPSNPGRFNLGAYEAYQIGEKRDTGMLERVIQRECGTLTDTALEECTQQVTADAALIVGRIHSESVASLSGLQSLLKYLGTIDGAKSLILISDGLVVENASDLNETIRLADLGRITANVLMLDLPRSTISQGSLGPTASEDRAMRVSGLDELAARLRSGVSHVLGDGQLVFDRISTELSAYYLLGVEQGTGDRDNRSHRIDVDVRRRGVQVRSRRSFVLSSTAGTRRPEQTLAETLRSPFGIADLPLRITTYASQSAANAKVDIIVAADVGQAGAAADTFAVGLLLVDAEGRVAASRADRVKLSPVAGAEAAPLQYLTALQAAPGTYSLRFGVVDGTGRRGSVVREVKAWQMTNQTFAVGDLMVGARPPEGRRLQPGVEPHVAGAVIALVDLYARAPASFESAAVQFDVAANPDGPTLMTVPGRIESGREPASRVAGALIDPTQLAPGRYIVRARVERDGKPTGVLMRPFVLDVGPVSPEAAAAGVVAAAAPVAAVAAPPLTVSLGRVADFDRNTLLAGSVVASMLDVVEKRSPSLKSAMASARAAKYGAAAIEALAAGDQTAAAFLKGLDWYSKGEMDQAANQMAIAAGPRREFFPAALYLGASMAAAGQDREAAAVWQLSIGSESRLPVVYPLFADARFRAGQPESVIDVLGPAYQRAPTDDEIGRRLAAAYVMTGRLADAVPVLDGYLSRHSTDNDALFAAIVIRYSLAGSGTKLTDADRDKLARYAQSYQGPNRALAEKYVETLRSR